MRPSRPSSGKNDLFRERLHAIINPRHPLARLSELMAWSRFDEAFAGQAEPGREDVRKEEPATAPPGIAGLTQAQVNLVQAAFKAGVKPSAIARQFSISPKLIQKVLAKKGR